jgi:TrmH family RNA methyltransferase
MSVKQITSFENPLIKRVVDLHDKKGRSINRQCIVEGLRANTTFVQAGMSLSHLFVTERTMTEVSSLCPQDKLVLVSEAVMKKISLNTTPSGIVGVFYLPDNRTPHELSAGLVLVQIQDPGNMGTLIRTAVALDRKSIVIVEGVDPWSPKVIQASAGTVALAKIFLWSWQELLIHKGALSLCALVVAGGKAPTELALNKSLLVVGNEAHGLPEALQQKCDTFLTLPMPGGAESLNAAVAGAIALYCAWAQTSEAQKPGEVA